LPADACAEYCRALQLATCTTPSDLVPPPLQCSQCCSSSSSTAGSSSPCCPAGPTSSSCRAQSGSPTRGAPQEEVVAGTKTPEEDPGVSPQNPRDLTTSVTG